MKGGCLSRAQTHLITPPHPFPASLFSFIPYTFTGSSVQAWSKKAPTPTTTRAPVHTQGEAASVFCMRGHRDVNEPRRPSCLTAHDRNSNVCASTLLKIKQHVCRFVLSSTRLCSPPVSHWEAGPPAVMTAVPRLTQPPFLYLCVRVSVW